MSDQKPIDGLQQGIDENEVKIPKLGASAEAKLIIERKKITTETIPEDVSRAKASSWLDLISPLTEWAGLRGDQLRHKRELLRVHQDNVLYDIVLQARSKIRAIDHAGAATPTKFLIPFIEKASIEGPEPELQDLWASLLASSYEDYKPEYIHFCNIISQMSLSQARALKSIIGDVNHHQLEIAMDNINIWYNASVANISIAEQLEKISGECSAEKIVNSVLELLDHTGIAIVNIMVELPDGSMLTGDVRENEYKDEFEVDYNILEAIGLIERVHVNWFEYKQWATTCTYYALRPLGYHFALRCGLANRT